VFVDITKGTPGLRAVTVFGRKAGESIVTDESGYCATFGIDGVNINQLIGGTNRLFDANGEISSVSLFRVIRKVRKHSSRALCVGLTLMSVYRIWLCRL